MKLRQWVESASTGTLGERLSFEQGMVEAGADAAARGMPMTCEMDTSSQLWTWAFQFWPAFTGRGEPRFDERRAAASTDSRWP